MSGLAIAATLAGLTEAQPVPVLVAGSVLLTVCAALAFDALGGALLGLAAAAGLIGIRRLVGDWGPESFEPALVEVLGLVAAGAAAGSTGRALRRVGTIIPAASGLMEPVYGLLGFVAHDAALARLEEEVERARAHSRPLALVLIDIEVTDPSLEGTARESALRAVARVLETRIREHDVPFAIDADRLGAIMPETSSEGAWQRVGDVLDALSLATFMARDDLGPKYLSGVVDLHVGLTELSQARSSPDALLDTAIANLDRSRVSEGAGS